MERNMAEAKSRASTNLTIGVVVFVVSLVAHNANHARLGLTESPPAVVWAGTLVLMFSAAMVTLVVVRHRLAASYCAVGGALIALGVTASHLLPKWGPLSDPILTEPASLITRIAVFGEIVGAMFLAYTAWRVRRTQSPAHGPA